MKRHERGSPYSNGQSQVQRGGQPGASTQESEFVIRIRCPDSIQKWNSTSNVYTNHSGDMFAHDILALLHVEFGSIGRALDLKHGDLMFKTCLIFKGDAIRKVFMVTLQKLLQEKPWHVFSINFNAFP